MPALELPWPVIGVSGSLSGMSTPSSALTFVQVTAETPGDGWAGSTRPPSGPEAPATGYGFRHDRTLRLTRDQGCLRRSRDPVRRTFQ